MRVKLYSVIMLAVVTFTACSNDEMSETQTQKGLTLSASVENLSTRASMKDESGTWKFAFETNDPVSVSNSKITEDYTFQKTGEQFTCANAMATNEAADWYAYFPSNNVDLTGQNGTLNGVANYLAAAGKTTQATTGENGLAITLHAQVAVLRIVEADKKGALDIQVKTADGKKWVTGLSAQKNQTKFDVKTSGPRLPCFPRRKSRLAISTMWLCLLAWESRYGMAACSSAKQRPVLQQASTTPLLLCLPKGKAMPLLMAKTYWWVGYSCGQVVQDLPPRTWQNQ